MDDIQSWWEVPSIAHFCSLFRVAFNLLDFDIEELEEALLTDGAEDAGSSLLQELIVRLLCGCLANNDVSTFNYQMFLRRLFRQKFQECGRENPFNTDIDFQFLPLRTKVEILHALCDFRLDAEDVPEVLKYLDSDSLRIMPLGYDENNSAYWYFYGTRLYKEEYKTIQKKKAKEKRKKGKEDKRKKKNNKSLTDSDSEEIGTGTWQVVCFTEHDWDKLTTVMRDSTSRVERSLYSTLSEDFLPEIPRLFAEKERLQRKRLLDYQPRRQSSRLEKLKQQKFEEQIVRDDENLGPPLIQDESSKSSLVSLSREGRAARALQRSDCGSGESRGNSQSSNRSGSRPVGRQTNNSLASATGPIVIQGAQRKLRSSLVFRQTEEDLQTGMYKILKTIKTHEDAWPFVDPVEEEYAPRYYSIVNKPMDLQRMEDKLDEGEYLNFVDFKTDFQLIVDNCRKYNGTENEYTEMVGNLEEAFRVAADRYLESDPSSDEEVTVRFPPTPAESHAPARDKHRHRPPKHKEDHASIPESTLSPESRSVTSPPPTDVEDKYKTEKESEREDMSSQNSSRDRDAGRDRNRDRHRDQDRGRDRDQDRDRDRGRDRNQDRDRVRDRDQDRDRSRDRDRAEPARPAKGQPAVKPKKRKVEVAKNAEAIQALELATEQTLKDINKWLDDTPRFSEYSSASNSPSHLPAAAEELELSGGGGKVEADYRSRLKLDRPAKPAAAGNKDGGKRRTTKDAGKPVPRREIQRTIERLQPGKSKGNLISNMQLLNAAKVKEEEGGSKPKESRKESGLPPEEKPELKLSLGTVLTSDVLGFDVGKASHSFTDNELKPETVDRVETRSDDEMSQSSQETAATAAPAKQELSDKPTAKPKKADESSKANHSAWFKAFGAPKPPAPAKPRRTEPEERRPIAAVRPMAQLPPAPPEEPRIELRSPEAVSPAPRSQEPVSPRVTPRQRKASTGSSVSERSFLSQDLTDPLDNSCSPRLVLDERLGGYSSAHYPSPMNRSPMAASPVMASPRTDEPKHPSYPPPNGTIRVGFYQDTSSAFPRASPDKPAPPPPAYTPRAFPPAPGDGNAGFLPYQAGPAAPAPAPAPAAPPPQYESPAAPAYPSLMHYYDTSKPLTDQYQAARPQPQPAPAHSYVNSVAPRQTPVIPVKKRMYTQVEVNAPLPQHHQQLQHHPHSQQQQPQSVPQQQQQQQQLQPQQQQQQLQQLQQPRYQPMHDEMSLNGMAHGRPPTYDAPPDKPGPPPQYSYPPMEMQQPAHQPADPNLGYRGPYAAAAAPTMGNLANLSHIVDRYAGEDRLLSMTPPFYGDKGMFAQPANAMQGSMPTPMFQQAGAGGGLGAGAYGRDGYQRPDMSAMLGNKVAPMQPQYNRTIPDMGGMMNNKPGDMQAIYSRAELTSMLQNKSAVQGGYPRPVSDLSMLGNRSTPPVDPYNPAPDLSTLLSNKGAASLPYNRPMSDYAMLPSKPVEQQQPAPPPAKPARKRKAKATAAAQPQPPPPQQPAEATGFQHYAKSAEQPIALKTASIVPGSAFNFGPAPPAMGLYSDGKDGYPTFLEDYRTAPSGYYVPEPGRDKAAQGPGAPAFPFLGQPRAPPYQQLSQAFMNHHQPLMDSSSYPYFRHQEEMMRHSSNPMVLHQGLLAPPTGYPPGYHPALGMRQPYDALNRPTWL